VCYILEECLSCSFSYIEANRVSNFKKDIKKRHKWDVKVVQLQEIDYQCIMSFGLFIKKLAYCFRRL